MSSHIRYHPQAVYSVLVEAEHRSTTPLPYWNLPFANLLVPRLRKFNVSLVLGHDLGWTKEGTRELMAIFVT